MVVTIASVALAASTSCASLADAAPAPVDPVAEMQNVALANTRANAYSDPAMQAQILQEYAAMQQRRVEIRAADSERQFDPNVCTVGFTCVTDPRLLNWADGQGVVKPFLFTSREGATLSGHVWMTEGGPAKRPAVVIVNGSIAVGEEVYWWAAQALAKAGYLVVTFDPQGEGVSDAFGESPDETAAAGAGIPYAANGLPFYDGATDALDFLFSTPSHPYVPRKSRGGTSHAAKQDRRVKAGLDAAYNPLWQRLDRTRVGITGNSYGAVAASWVGQADPRVKAVVAWDSLCTPVWPAPSEDEAFNGSDVTDYQGGHIGTTSPTRFSRECFAAPEGPAPKLTKPALGLYGDYVLTPGPWVTAPDPDVRNQASVDLSKAGIDTGDIAIRGGTHEDYALIPGTTASLRGVDIAAWYTVAWFDKYLRHDPTADRRLLSDRWRHDEAGAAADPKGDPNMLSYHFRSRLDVRLDSGKRFACENLRDGCAGQVARAGDCGPSSYDVVAVDTGKAEGNSCRRKGAAR